MPAPGLVTGMAVSLDVPANPLLYEPVAVLVCCVRHEAPIVERGGRPFLLGRRSGLIEAGGSLIRGTLVRAGSSPDNAGTCWHCQTVRVRLARPVGVTRVNQWLKPRKKCPAQIWWIGAGGAVRDPCSGQLRSRVQQTVGRPR